MQTKRTRPEAGLEGRYRGRHDYHRFTMLSTVLSSKTTPLLQACSSDAYILSSQLPQCGYHGCNLVSILHSCRSLFLTSPHWRM
jgi:hypothetical protein